MITYPTTRQVVIGRATCAEHEDSDHWTDRDGNCYGTWDTIKTQCPYPRHIGSGYYRITVPEFDALPLWLTDMHTADAAELSQPEQDW